MEDTQKNSNNNNKQFVYFGLSWSLDDVGFFWGGESLVGKKRQSTRLGG